MEASSGGICAVTAGPDGAQNFKPSVSLNKTGYAKLVQYMQGAIEDPDVSNIAVDTVTVGLRETLGFDPASKQSEEARKKNYENKKRRASEKGMSIYEMTVKPRYQRLRKQYPELPSNVLTKSMKEISEAAAAVRSTTDA